VLSLVWRNSGVATGLSTGTRSGRAVTGDTHGVSEPALYTVVVLAGGTARRMGGGDKTALDLGAGQSVLGHLVGGLERTVPVVVVGPERALERSVRWTHEDPPGAGPLAGLAAGLAADLAAGFAALPEPESDWVVVLAGDQPFAARGVEPLLAGRAPEVDAVVAVDAGGRDQPLLAAYRRAAVVNALAPLGSEVAGRSMSWLLDRLRVVHIPLPDVVLLDVDDPASLARARTVLREQSET
jgi:molybdopterin-guanine dinucleotide biosynthesis protein A